MSREEEVRKQLATVMDPEVPVLSIIDLGILRDIEIIDNDIKVEITPTYSGCPAMGLLESEIKLVLDSMGFENTEIVQVLSPAWTTDWMTEEGKRKLEEYGIAPPRLGSEKEEIKCPQCGSKDSSLISQFSSTSCKALYRCGECLEPFEYFKCL